MSFGIDSEVVEGSWVSEGWVDRVGRVVTFTKSVSEADMALFALITREDTDIPEEPTPPVRQPRQPASLALLASLLMAAAARHLETPARAPFTAQRLDFFAPPQTDDTLTIRAELVTYDAAADTSTITLTCQNQEQRPLAQGECTLRVG